MNKTTTNKTRIQGTNFRWVVPQLSPEIWDKKQQFKAQILDTLLASKTAKKGIKYYSIAIESHADGNPHLDMLLIFKKKVELQTTELDFLCSKHGNLTRYRNLNAAIIDYGWKEDTPLTDISSSEFLLKEQKLKENPYEFCQEQMLADPFNFDLAEFCHKNDYFKLIKGYTTIQTKLKKHQEAACNSILRNKQGLKHISLSDIEQILDPVELIQFKSWSGYFQILNFINEIPKFHCQRPFKSKQLLLVGGPNTGKTTLNRTISRLVPTYEIGVPNWWPKYKDGMYEFFSWNEFNLKEAHYPDLLKLLEGTPTHVQVKGGHAYRGDNQLIIMNSNLTMWDHLKSKFGSFSKLNALKHSLQNFPARVTQINIPEGKNLFLLTTILERFYNLK